MLKTPTEETKFAPGTQAVATEVQIIPAPNQTSRIVLLAIIIQNNTTTSNTATIRSGGVEILSILAENKGDGIAMNLGDTPWRLAAGKNLSLQLSSATSVKYNFVYQIEQV